MEANQPEYLRSLNETQREAVLYNDGPLLLLAGAGSGKTRVITTKIAYLIDRLGVDPRSILAVTFTNKAAGEMRERVASLVPGGREVMIRTFHSFGAWLLRRHSALLDLNSSFTIYDDEDMVSLLQGLFPAKKKRELTPYARLISRAKDYGLGPEDDLQELSMEPEFKKYYRLYEERLHGMGNADFGDLILRPAELFQAHPHIRDRFRMRFPVILVDEYQDSNVAQYQLLKELAGPESLVCVVGDDDQSIYKFRGAEVRNILTFPECFPGTRIIRLEQNYRSTRPILDAAVAVVARNRDRMGKQLWTDKEGGALPRVVFLEDQDAETRFCAELLEDGNLAGTAILYRTNAQSMAFETAFSRMGIPYRIVGALRFLEREEVKDALAVLALMANPRDEISFRRIINKPSRGIGKSSVQRILEAVPAAGGDLIAAANQAAGFLSKKAAAGVRQFVTVYDELQALLPQVALAEFIAEAVRVTGLLEFYRERDRTAATQKEGNLDQLISAAANYVDGRQGLAAFLEEMQLDRTLAGRDARGEEEPEEAVTLITMHNTKGLEFDRVIITGMEQDLFPSSREETLEALEEERRIFYVSITRAREELYLTSCRSRFIWGRRRQLYPSPFLEELPEDGVEYVGGVAPGLTGFSAGAMEADNAYPPGTRVYHEDFGPGHVEKSGFISGELSVTVRFDTGRSGKFLPEYTSLEKIADEW